MMSDVFKKRLTGVIVLVLLGVLVPLLLSRWMHGGSGTGRGSMRVYEIKPNGSASPAGQGGNQGATQGAVTQGKTQGGNNETSAAMPQGAPAGQDGGGQHGQGGGGFSTPPVREAGSSQASSANPPPVQGGSGTLAGGSHQPSRNASQGASRSGAAPPRPTSGGPHQGGGQSAQSASAHGSTKLENAHISGWVVQVASFSDPDHAADLVRRLRGTFNASYAPGQVKGQTWYRVNVGPFSSKDAASQAAARLGKQGYKGLVRHIP